MAEVGNPCDLGVSIPKIGYNWEPFCVTVGSAVALLYSFSNLKDIGYLSWRVEAVCVD